MKTILVTGGNGQLAKCIKEVVSGNKKMQFVFANADELDITNQKEVQTFFDSNEFDYCINCAAYTAVDLAEKHKKKAQEINVKGVSNLALTCKNKGTILIQISTDFVFDGEKKEPYTESDDTNPIGVYGQTKLGGEKEIQRLLKKYFIIRTSWLYSEYGNNFMKTMLKHGKEKDQLNVVNDQKGTPTYAKDLAKVILKIIKSESEDYGLYNYSNEGAISWFDFTKEIFYQEKMEVKTNPVSTSAYPTLAKRPKNSVLDKTKIKQVFQMEIPYWKDALKEALNSYRKL